MKNNFHIRELLTPSVSEQDYYDAEFALYGIMAHRYRDYLPAKWRHKGTEILERSTCFKEWFLKIVNRNNGFLVELFTVDGYPKQSLHQWTQMQLFYFETNGFYPHTMIVQAAVNEWLHRVSQTDLEPAS